MTMEWEVDRSDATHTLYTHKTSVQGWDDLVDVLEAQFAKLGELLASTYAQAPFRRIYFDFVPDVGRVLGIPCAQDVTKLNNFPMTVAVQSSFLENEYAALPDSYSVPEVEWEAAFDANTARFRAALQKALATPTSRKVLDRMRQGRNVAVYLQIWDTDENIEQLPV
jgi:hypothetical protein